MDMEGELITKALLANCDKLKHRTISTCKKLLSSSAIQQIISQATGLIELFANLNDICHCLKRDPRMNVFDIIHH